MKALRTLATAAMCGLAGAGAAAEIELVRDGKAYELSAAPRAYIAEQLPRLFSTCSLNSRDHPQIFAARDPGARWRETAAGSHLIVRFATPLDVGHPHHGALAARQLMLGLPETHYPAPQLSRDGERVVAHTKCSGGDTIRFVCAGEIKPLMPGSYHRACDLLEEAER